mgnify:CR=1 FL=1|jgi:ankyrin repeat protein
MGCNYSQAYANKFCRKNVPIEKSILSLLIAGRTDDCLDLMKKQNSKKYSDAVNSHGDNLLHFACKLNNYEVCKYILHKDPQAASTKNLKNKQPL